MTEYKKCKNGHIRSPENVNKRGACKECVKIHNDKWNTLLSIQRANNKKTVVATCKNSHLRTPDNLYKNGTCKQCMKNRKEDPVHKKERSKKYRDTNKEKIKIAQRKSIQKNKEYYLEKRKNYRIINKDRIAEYSRKKYFENPHIKHERTRRRQSSKLQRTPKWLTKEQINEMRMLYRKAKMLFVETGIKHHIDHIIPLQGKTVSGLHVPWNLQILTAQENIKKHNKLVVL